MSGNVSNHVWVVDATKPLGGYWTRQVGSSGGAAYAAIKTDDTQIVPYSEVIYSGTAAGNTPTSGLSDWCDWTFHILGVDADDDVTIQASLDGTNFVEMGVVEITTNTFVAAGTPIETAGLYKFAAAASVMNPSAVFEALKITRNTATGSNSVTVRANGKPVN